MNETGNREQGTGNKSGDGMDALLSIPSSNIESLRAHVNRLHAERGEAVLEAKKVREALGFSSAAFQMDWAHVESLTRAIVHYEAELEKALLGHEERPLLRDPDVEMPDDGFHVIAVTDDETESVVLAYHDGDAWYEVDDCGEEMTGSVVGWCWQDEAAEALRKAVAHA